MTTLMVKNGTVITMNARRDIIEDGTIVLDGDKILEVGRASKIEGKYKPEKIINAKGKVVMPGLINAHTHAIDILLRGGLAHDRQLYDWLFNVCLPGYQAFTPQDAQIAATLYCMEALQSGITTIVDVSNPSSRFEALAESTINVYRNLGVRAIYARLFVDMVEENISRLAETYIGKEPEIIHPEETVEDTDAVFNSIERLIRKFHRKENGRLQVWPSPSIPGMVTKEGFIRSLEVSEKYGTGISTHISETRFDWVPYGMSAIQYLEAIGFLNPKVLAAHCVWLTDKDLRVMRAHNVKVSHQPSVNMVLADGVAPVQGMLDHGITVGLGTDNACFGNVNMFFEMKLTALLHKVHNLDPTVMTGENVLEAATINGARAIGMEGLIGSIEKGKKADLIILNVNQLRPYYYIPSTLVYQATGKEVETVIIDGKIVMENRKIHFIDEIYGNQLFTKAQEASENIVERANLKGVIQKKRSHAPYREAKHRGASRS